MSNLAKAITIAAAAHQNQLDKNGTAYILHPIRVMLKMDGNLLKTAAILHDVVEDTDWTLDMLRSEGFSERIIELIDLLTRRDSESYDDYIERIRSDGNAVKIKLADLEDNMDLTRLPSLSENDFTRLARSHKNWLKLQEDLKQT